MVLAALLTSRALHLPPESNPLNIQGDPDSFIDFLHDSFTKVSETFLQTRLINREKLRQVDHRFVS
jgi:hypothetical protein